MLSISARGSAASAANYYEHLSAAHGQAEDYYSAGGGGQWHGSGAKELGLSGDVSRDQFMAMAQGYSPATGEALTQRAGEQHRAGWDLTFSAPKSVSTAWALGDAEQRRAIEEAHNRAVEKAISYVERTAGYSRTGHGAAWNNDESRRETAGLAVAVYQHGTSRNTDPQIHSHCMVFNVAARADGSTGALDSYPLMTQKMASGAAYRAELAAALREHGYQIEQTAKGTFEVTDVPQDLRDAFSSRRTEIEDRMRELGTRSAKAAEVAALDTRAAKEEVDPVALRQAWRDVAADVSPGWSIDDAQHSAPPEPTSQMPTTEEALHDLTENRSVFRGRDIDRLAFEHAAGAGLDLQQAEQWSHSLAATEQVVPLQGPHGETLYTTTEMLALESRLVERGEQMSTRENHSVSESDLSATLKNAPTLSAEQAAMVVHVTRTTGDLAIVQGDAGTGKSFALGVARDAWEHAGYDVRGAALAGKAAEGLQSGSGIESTTLARTLMDTQSWQDSRGEWHEPSNPLTENTVLVVDEAGMVDSRTLAEVMQRADEAGAKVVLVGDSKQLQPIGAGAPFADLSERLGSAGLTDIRRQSSEADRQAVRDLAAGRADRALQNLAERDRVHSADTPRDAKAATGAAVVNDLADGRSAIAIAATRADVRDINQTARSAMQDQGRLGESTPIDTTNGTRDFAAGDRILMTKNDKNLDVKNGDFGTVTDVRQTGDGEAHITVQLDRGREVTVDTVQYSSLDHGYAATAHKSQGATVDTAHIYSGGVGMEGREWSYVAGSRAREETHVYADTATIDDLAPQWSRSHQAVSTQQYDVADNHEPVSQAKTSAPNTDHETHPEQQVSHEETVPQVADEYREPDHPTELEQAIPGLDDLEAAAGAEVATPEIDHEMETVDSAVSDSPKNTQQDASQTVPPDATDSPAAEAEAATQLDAREQSPTPDAEPLTPTEKDAEILDTPTEPNSAAELSAESEINIDGKAQQDDNQALPDAPPEATPDTEPSPVEYPDVEPAAHPLGDRPVEGPEYQSEAAPYADLASPAAEEPAVDVSESGATEPPEVSQDNALPAQDTTRGPEPPQKPDHDTANPVTSEEPNTDRVADTETDSELLAAASDDITQGWDAEPAPEWLPEPASESAHEHEQEHSHEQEHDQLDLDHAAAHDNDLGLER